jgi:purine-binding chemotaxis protein CheW
MSSAAHESSANIREFVAFRVGGQDFCIDIMAVREIRSAAEMTCLPHSAAYIRGLTNLRGVVMPVINLAARLGMPPQTADIRHVIVVVWIGSQLVGLEVDSVDDILSVDQETLQPAPDMVGNVIETFVRAVVTVESRLICVLALESLLPDEKAVAA